MRKIPTVFERDWDGDRSRVLDRVHTGTEWVFAGEGVPTRKYDGTCVLVRDGRLYKRHEVRAGKTEPAGFEPVEDDDETGKRIGWVPVGDGPEDRWHREAWESADYADGTYELLGPKIQGNLEQYAAHTLVPHSEAERLDGIEATYDALRDRLAVGDIEGIVWHHPDGRMAKIKAKDFGVRRLTTSSVTP